ncbi:ABC transporter substrate-binding protein [Pyxidicoccus xibeiensis]|uniref:ABC transporter substrate-binding protein n=1 Tax=Pyxidicoccus xibeiensis TaxID=2906759 RepID=UPI0020A83192|nr:ABC transporter substrate-binding protein [Pyxidicoccus xibeiensis]MCP3141334.1 ABC transporter substrate-binding protein [Pyxidicoccus xibeiensis]
MSPRRDVKRLRGLAPWLLLGALTCAGAVLAEPGVSPTEVVLGQPAAFSGPSAGLGVEMWRGASAAFAEANAAGGVHGRKVRIVAADDALNPEQAAPAALRLLKEQQVFALFGGVGDATLMKVLPVLLRAFQREQAFYFAPSSGAQPQREPPWEPAVFNVRASYRQEIRAIVDAFIALGRRRIGLFVQNDAFGAIGRDAILRALQDYGLKPAADATYRKGQDFTVSTQPQLEVLRAGKTDAIIAIGTAQACAALIRDARLAGWDLPIHSPSVVGADALVSLLRAEEQRVSKPLLGNLIFTQVVPSYDDTDLDLVQQYRAAMERHRPTAPPGLGGGYTPASLYSFGSLEGYISARAMLAVLEKTGPELTRQRFHAAAESMGKFDLGLRAVGELSPTRHQVLSKVWFTYVTAEGWRTTSAPGTVLR